MPLHAGLHQGFLPLLLKDSWRLTFVPPVTRRGLTCEDVVIAVDLVELNALVQHIQLFCCQHLPFPVGVAYDSRGRLKSVDFFRTFGGSSWHTVLLLHEPRCKSILCVFFFFKVSLPSPLRLLFPLRGPPHPLNGTPVSRLPALFVPSFSPLTQNKPPKKLLWLQMIGRRNGHETTLVLFSALFSWRPTLTPEPASGRFPAVRTQQKARGRRGACVSKAPMEVNFSESVLELELQSTPLCHLLHADYFPLTQEQVLGFKWGEFCFPCGESTFFTYSGGWSPDYCSGNNGISLWGVK